MIILGIVSIALGWYAQKVMNRTGILWAVITFAFGFMWLFLFNYAALGDDELMIASQRIEEKIGIGSINLTAHVVNGIIGLIVLSTLPDKKAQ